MRDLFKGREEEDAMKVSRSRGFPSCSKGRIDVMCVRSLLKQVYA